jgi:signal transduction histidine kinase
LLTLISNLIDLAKLETGTLNIFNEKVNLAELLEDLEDEMVEERTIYEKEKLKLKIDRPSNGTTFLETDRARLFQVLKIFFDNSLKYTDAGEIGLEVTKDPAGFTCFTLRDTGKGIDPETLNNLFGLFPVGRIESNAKVKSRGLGMLVAHRLTEKMDGRLNVQSEPGSGTTIFLRLPRQELANS